MKVKASFVHHNFSNEIDDSGGGLLWVHLSKQQAMVAAFLLLSDKPKQSTICQGQMYNKTCLESHLETLKLQLYKNNAFTRCQRNLNF